MKPQTTQQFTQAEHQALAAFFDAVLLDYDDLRKIKSQVKKAIKKTGNK